MPRLPFLALLALTSPALANDSVAGFALGALELRQTDSIRMVSEVLVLSPQEVSVDYVFRNTTAAPVSAIVAFPLPELARLDEDSDHAIPCCHHVNASSALQSRTVARRCRSRTGQGGDL